MAIASSGAPYAELFTPKLVTILRGHYGWEDLKSDALAGLTVAIVALPLSMAIAIASGVSPERGLYTSIVGGFIISAVGGSRFQIGGPAGAFIVLVSATVVQHGLDGLLLATIMSGVILAAAGALRLGTFIKYIPYPVTIGFTAGIALIIFASQVSPLLGLTIADEPGPLVPKIIALAGALPTVNAAAVAIAAATIALIVAIRRYRPHWPSFIIAVGIATIGAGLIDLPAETIGGRFGGIPGTLPTPRLPSFELARLVELLPSALSFALLGSIESLLSAVVADSMTGRRHRSNCELVAQGFANIASGLFGGICATGNIARTATNVRAGARSPVSGMFHAVFLLLFVLVAAPLASNIPLAALAAVLVVVAWNMAERHAAATLIRASRGDAVVLLATLLLTIFRDLTTGIVAGFAIAALLFLHRMAQSVTVENARPIVEEDRPDEAPGEGRGVYRGRAVNQDVIVLRVSGAFFFGAAAAVAAALDRIAEHPKAYVIDFGAVPVIDSTAVATIEGFVRQARQHHAAVYFAGARPAIRRQLLAQGVRRSGARFAATVDDALAAAHEDIAAREPKKAR